jgi:hypothetical protein
LILYPFLSARGNKISFQFHGDINESGWCNTVITN